jgi:hypothetical protein
MEHYLRKPWCEEKDKWFANIYQETFSAGLCFALQSRIDYTEKMRGMIKDFIKETGMTEEDSDKLHHTLIKAEKKLRRGNLHFSRPGY